MKEERKEEERKEERSKCLKNDNKVNIAMFHCFLGQINIKN